MVDLNHTYDIVIIGGGATGLGSAVDAASRGYKTLLVEQADFGKGTSSRSTKLVHGGVRYLAQGNIKLVREALAERGRLLKNAPLMTSTQPFVVPVFSLWEKFYYSAGLMLYDVLSGKLSLGKTRLLSRKKTLELLPNINPKKVAGGILYYDGQFNDAELCIELAHTAERYGATILNYTKAVGFIKEKDIIVGVELEDTLGAAVSSGGGCWRDGANRLLAAMALLRAEPSVANASSTQRVYLQMPSCKWMMRMQILWCILRRVFTW
jgi:glycerol-3-phosphate dehydrogenase